MIEEFIDLKRFIPSMLASSPKYSHAFDASTAAPLNPSGTLQRGFYYSNTHTLKDLFITTFFFFPPKRWDLLSMYFPSSTPNLLDMLPPHGFCMSSLPAHQRSLIKSLRNGEVNYTLIGVASINYSSAVFSPRQSLRRRFSIR